MASRGQSRPRRGRRSARRRGGDAGGSADLRIARTPGPQSAKDAASAAAAAGRRDGATLQRLGVRRGERQDRPPQTHTDNRRSSLAAAAQSEAQPVGARLRRLPRAKKLGAGGVASPAVGGAPSGQAERGSQRAGPRLRPRGRWTWSPRLLAGAAAGNPLPPRLHSAPKPRDVASRVCLHPCCNRF